MDIAPIFRFSLGEAYRKGGSSQPVSSAVAIQKQNDDQTNPQNRATRPPSQEDAVVVSIQSGASAPQQNIGYAFQKVVSATKEVSSETGKIQEKAFSSQGKRSGAAAYEKAAIAQNSGSNLSLKV